MRFEFSKIMKLVLVVLMISFVSACGGGSDEAPSAGDDSGICLDVSGDWYLTESKTSSTCSSGIGAPEYYTATVTQNGCSVTMTDGSTSLSGTVGNSSITFPGVSRPSESGVGTVTVSEMTMTISGDLNNISGTNSWTWADGNSSFCEGSTEVAGTRMLPASFDVTGNWEGTWDDGSGLTGTFDGSIIQQPDATLTGNISVPYAGVFGAPVRGIVSGNQMTFGDIGGIISFTGTITVNGLASGSGTFDYPSLGVSGTWTGGT